MRGWLANLRAAIGWKGGHDRDGSLQQPVSQAGVGKQFGRDALGARPQVGRDAMHLRIHWPELVDIASLQRGPERVPRRHGLFVVKALRLG